MKLLIFLLFVSTSLSAQTISFTYTDKNGVRQPFLEIKPDTKEIILENAPDLKDFIIKVADLSPNNQLLFIDKNDEPVGTPYLSTDGEKSYHSPASLNNKKLIIYYIDANSVKKLYATIVILDKLPSSKFNILQTLSEAISSPKEICKPCNYTGRSLTYDFATNTSTLKNSSDKKQWPKVGEPFSFIVTNINPYRDSVVLSQEVISYNTDVPDIFSKAFFSTALTGEGDEKQQKILSDVLEMGKQLDVVIKRLKEANECDKICDIISKVVAKIETIFKGYGYDPDAQTLVNYIADELQNINEVYKDKVAAILTSYQQLRDTRNFARYYIPKVQNVDEYIFTLSILPKSGATLATIVDHQPIPAPTIGGFKIDFSSGLFITKLRDQRLSLKPDSTVIPNSYGADSIVYNRRFQIINESEKNKVDFGLAAWMHAYTRITPYINIGLNIGAGASIGPNPAIRYFGGGSLLLGRSGRLAINYGCVAGYVDVLSDGYKNQTYTSQGDLKALTKKSFRTGSYWGLSFNIPLFKAKAAGGGSSDTGSGDSGKSDTGSKDEKAKD